MKKSIFIRSLLLALLHTIRMTTYPFSPGLWLYPHISTIPAWGLSLILLITGCTGLRTEFYRGETHYLYENARQSYSKGDYAKARSAFETVLGMDPDYGPAHAALGNLDLIDENYAAALSRYRLALKVDPELSHQINPLMMVAQAHLRHAPLIEVKVDLQRIYELAMAERIQHIETLIEEVPLDLLAADTLSITPGRRIELQTKITRWVKSGAGGTRFRLLTAYMLFWWQADDDLAAVLFKEVVPKINTIERQKALVALGQIFERTEKLDNAVDTYLSAVESGMPMENVAHYLARIYQVDLETVYMDIADCAAKEEHYKPARIEYTCTLPKPVISIRKQNEGASMVEFENLLTQGAPNVF